MMLFVIIYVPPQRFPAVELYIDITYNFIANVIYCLYISYLHLQCI